jgi:Mg2+ and Co2+ transporter CorA
LFKLEVLELHLTDLLNNQLPSHYDYTSEYDVIIFRRLARGRSESDVFHPGQLLHSASSSNGPPILRRIDTSPIGFLVIDKLIITVHPADCSVRDAFAAKLLNAVTSSNVSHAANRLPANPTDLMLRLIGQVVDGYLDLRRELTRQLDHWQSELLNPRTRFNNWSTLLDSRLTLHYLDEVCEDQRATIQDWLEALDTWQADDTFQTKDLEMLRVRSRDLLEHIERIVHHVARLERSAETAVQMHFNLQSNRANDVMKTLTAMTAIFLPLNLITGFFGMNFEFLPLIHTAAGFWWVFGFMILLVIVVVTVFWRKQYLARTAR